MTTPAAPPPPGAQSPAGKLHQTRAQLLRIARRLPAPTIRIRLTLLYAVLSTLSGAALVTAMTWYVYHDLYAPLPANLVPPRLDPDHDRILSLADQIRDTATSHLLHDSLKLVLLVVAASALIGWWVAGRTLRRLTAITEAARHASETTLHERLNLPGPADEFKELGDTFDEMLERLDAAFAAQKRFVANASHELRTPLAVTRTAVEVTLAKPAVTDTQWRAMAADVQRSTARAQNLIDGLLTLARSEQAPGPAEEDDLADLAAEALDQTAAPARARALRVEADLDPTPVRGNIALLARAVANLLENAVRHNIDGGTVHVATRTDGPWAQLTVENDGAQLNPEDVPLLFEPFHRGPRTRSSDDVLAGAGLGLSIVRAVADAHGGTVDARARPGGGLTVTLRLPTPAPAPTHAHSAPHSAARPARDPR
jgi:two-component system sensor histidine kinase VanS